MTDYLNSASDTVSTLFGAIQDCSNKEFEQDIEVQHLRHLESYLLNTGDPTTWGKRNFEDWKKRNDGESPSIEDVRAVRDTLEELVDARRQTIEIMCASILMIAQNGVKLVLGAPSVWKRHEGVVLSSQNECVLCAIWHGRNLAAHVEGLKKGTPSFRYFEDIKQRRGIDLKLRASHPCRYILKNLLGWIELHDLFPDDSERQIYPSPYRLDMTRIGQLR